MQRKPLSAQSAKTLARHLRQRFSKTILPHILERVSDAQLVAHYFQDAERKRRALSEKASLACSSQPIEA